MFSHVFTGIECSSRSHKKRTVVMTMHFIGSSQNNYFLKPGGGVIFQTVLLGQWESITGNLVLTTELKS